MNGEIRMRCQVFKAICIYFLVFILIIFSWNRFFKNEFSGILTQIKNGFQDNGLLNKSPLNECTMKIFIHGTLLIYPSFRAFKKTLIGKNEQRKYSKPRGFLQKYLDNLREGGIYQSQLISSKGLCAVNLDAENTPVNKILALYKKNNDGLEKNKDKSFLYYTFGWSGRLDKKERMRWAKKLYKEILQEIEVIKQRDHIDKVNVELFGHSHGGNVILNLAMAEKKYKKNIHIDRVALLGTPVQSETAFLVESDIFERIYHLYSTGDNVQVVDLISTKDNFSRRRFKVGKDDGKKRSFLKTLPQKLVQIEVRCGKIKPMHTEFWFMSTKENFLKRKKFPLFPYPIISFMPVICDFIDNELSQSLNVTVSIEKRKNEVKFNFMDADFIEGTSVSISNFSLNGHLC